MASRLFDIKKSKALALAKKVIKDKEAREKAILYASTAVNYFFVLFQLYGGIRYKSVWFTALGVYYGVLTSVNLYIGLSRDKRGGEAWKVLRTSGWVLILANLSLIVIISTMIAMPTVALHDYSTVMAIGVTVWTFYLLIAAIVGIVKERRKKNAIAMAGNTVRLIGAVVSVLMLQTAMIASYGIDIVEQARNTIDQIENIAGVPAELETMTDNLIRTFVESNRITGILVLVAVILITIYMIVKGGIEYKKARK